MYDVIIIGAGPAGFTAAIYAVRRDLKCLVLGQASSGQVMWASEIENYPGIKSISGAELILKMQDQVNSLGVESKEEDVSMVAKSDQGFEVTTNKSVYQAKALIIAMGLSPQRLAIPGELEFAGRGVTYCATCDGPFYRGKTVAVVGGGNSALDAAELLSKIAERVYLIHRRDEFKGFEGLVEEVKARPNIELVLNSEVKNILGEQKVGKIEVANVATKESREIDIDGLFIEIGRVASTDLVGELVERNEKNQIKVDERCQTRTPGVFAAGDVTAGEFKQIIIACGQGAIAALSAYQYLQIKEGKGGGMLLDRGHKG